MSSTTSGVVIDLNQQHHTLESYQKSLSDPVEHINELVKKCNQSFNAALGWILIGSIAVISSIALARYKNIKISKLFVIANIFSAVITISLAFSNLLKRQKRANEFESLSKECGLNYSQEFKISEQKTVSDGNCSLETYANTWTKEQIDNFKKYCPYGMKDKITTIYKVTIQKGSVSLFSAKPIKFTITKLEDNLDAIRQPFKPWRMVFIDVITSSWVKDIHKSALSALGASCYIADLDQPRLELEDPDKLITYYPVQSNGVGITVQTGQGNTLSSYKYTNAYHFQMFLETTYPNTSRH